MCVCVCVCVCVYFSAAKQLRGLCATFSAPSLLCSQGRERDGAGPEGLCPVPRTRLVWVVRDALTTLAWLGENQVVGVFHLPLPTCQSLTPCVVFCSASRSEKPAASPVLGLPGHVGEPCGRSTPKDVHDLIPGSCDYVPSRGKGEFADGIQLSIWRQGDGPGLSGWTLNIITRVLLRGRLGDFPGGPVVKTPYFQCRGRKFDPWSGTKMPHAYRN